ncbi:mandelate racemase [Salmonella enterica subsp. enterica serovar Typhimurium]|nr:mandelate racemase [Salmonella enterica subsp. enterica serovar Typhimurium]
MIQPDICTCGGITEVKKICDMAHVYDKTVQIHVCGGPISTAVALHMETAIPNFVIHELHRYALLEPNTQTCKYNYLPKNGMYEVPGASRHRPGTDRRNHEKITNHHRKISQLSACAAGRHPVFASRINATLSSLR